MSILGMDPGLSGALVLIDLDGSVIGVWDMPTEPKLVGKGSQVEAQRLAEILRLANPERVCVESVTAMPRQGVSSTFAFGEGAGVVRGILAALGYPVVYVRAATWKRKFGLLKKPKSAAVTLARQLCPGMGEYLKLKKHEGRADAYLLAQYVILESGRYAA